MCEKTGLEWGWSATVQSENYLPEAGCFYKKGAKCWYGDFGSLQDKSEFFKQGASERLCCDD
jgi:hypothetical protein